MCVVLECKKCFTYAAISLFPLSTQVFLESRLGTLFSRDLQSVVVAKTIIEYSNRIFLAVFLAVLGNRY